MNDPKIKQQIVERIKGSSNILVTVSTSPSVDELSAALGLTLLLNKMDKHATAVFSGEIPPAITFLDPEKTFEDTTNSLRDFIIALDNEKADHLRYKLEGDLVKIYITPYRTTITGDDLEFSQGDYNVELVLALGVEDKSHLDVALDNSGKILHDATVVTLTAGEQTSKLGSIDWHDSNASSLSEMLVTLHDAMKLEKTMLDASIATAFLTGIVSATERFSNPKTSSRVMTIAAQLMGAGADQQLIATKLEEANEVEPEATAPKEEDNDKGESLTEGEATPLPKQPKAAAPKRADGELLISHEPAGTLDEVAEAVNKERLEASARAAERALEEQHEQQAAAVAAEPVAPRGAVQYTPPTSEAPAAELTEPTFGGTLNATSEQAEEDKRREIANDKNKVILSHSYIGGSQPSYDAPINGAVSGQSSEPSVADVFSGGNTTSSSEFVPQTAPTVEAAPLAPISERVIEPLPAVPAAPAEPQVTPAPMQTLADLDAQNRTPHDEARDAIQAAFAAAPQETPLATPPAGDGGMPLPADLGLPLPPPLPTDLSGLPPLPPATEQPGILGDILAPEAAPQPAAPPAAPPQFAQPQGTPADPGQFQIPGQQQGY
jgi:hypothetical protein